MLEERPLTEKSITSARAAVMMIGAAMISTRLETIAPSSDAASGMVA